jgi:lysophospholipase L1-like esterase
MDYVARRDMMSASTRISRRPRLPLAILLLLASIAAMLGLSCPASAARLKAPPVVAGSRYLALGDSFVFGYEESEVVPAPNYHVPASFIGYPEILASELHLTVANASCPGETSSSLINPAAQSNGCENIPGHPNVGYRLLFPLHVRYRGSQLSFALKYLRSHRNVRLVSLMIGGNDGLVCVETTKDGCSGAAEQNAVRKQVTHNIRTILKAIRHKAHYRGQLAIVNYYSPLIASNPLTARLNAVIDAAARPFGVEIANGFGVFQKADSHSGGNPCTAGLENQLGGPGICGIHPSYAGKALLAQALEKVIRL